MRGHVKVFGALLSILLVTGVFTYATLSPRGALYGVKHDLRNIEPENENSYTDLEGTPFALSSVAGEPLIINSWATWIPFSKDELTLMNEVKLEHPELNVLAINRMEDSEFMKSYIDAMSISRNITFLTDRADTFYKAIGGYATPETVVYRRDGTIALHKRGVMSREELEKTLQEILK